MIVDDYRLMLDAVDHYVRNGYKFVDVNWLVSKKASMTTCPPNAHSGRFMNTDKCFIASAEQAIIQMILDNEVDKKNLLNTKLVSFSPCVRLGDNQDANHQETFYKVELSYIYKDTLGLSDYEKSQQRLLIKNKLVIDALALFQQLTPLTVAYNDSNSDIELITSDSTIELGSYGWREPIGDYTLIYGTGMALPRIKTTFARGYHKSAFIKGKLGEISKIQEEVNELRDADQQGNKILQLCELSDLYGAVKLYADKLGVTMEDIRDFSELTKNAFVVGLR